MKLLSLALILSLFLIPSVQAITIQQGVSFNTTGTNTTYIAGANFTVDKITVTSTLLNITNSSTGGFIMSAIPSSGSLNITILGFNASYKKFNISSNASGITASFVIGNITPVSALMVFLKNGAYWNTFTSNASGYINFTYSEGYSNIQFEALQDTTAPTVSLSLSANPVYQGSAITISCSASDNYQLSSTSLTIAKPSGSTTATCGQPFTDTSAAGIYMVTYSATDTSGNTASASQSFGVTQLRGSSPKQAESSVTASSNGYNITASLNGAVSNPSITVTGLSGIPVAGPAGQVYNYLNVTRNNFNVSDIINATIEFKVNRSWIDANNITSIYLARYENGWSRLRTDFTGSEADANHYRAYTDAFSYFAIIGEKAALANNTENMTQANRTAGSGTIINGTQESPVLIYGLYAAAFAVIGTTYAIVRSIRRGKDSKKDVETEDYAAKAGNHEKAGQAISFSLHLSLQKSFGRP